MVDSNAYGRQLKCTVGLLALNLVWGCSGSRPAHIEDLTHREDLSAYQLKSVTGVRDGDVLDAQVIFTAGPSALAMEMRFRIGIPTRLESGRYSWRQGDKLIGGSIRERSITFLGGQSGRPSIGGTFELLSADGAPLYRVRLPTTEIAATG